MNQINFHLHLWATTYCTKSTTEATKGLVHRDVNGDKNDCFIFNSCFASNRPAEYFMDVVADIFGIVETNKYILYNNTINNMTTDWPGCYYLALKRIIICLGTCR